MEDRVGDSRVDAGSRDFAEAPAADRAGVLIDLVDELDVDVGGYVGVDGQRDASEVLGQQRYARVDRLELPVKAIDAQLEVDVAGELQRGHLTASDRNRSRRYVR